MRNITLIFILLLSYPTIQAQPDEEYIANQKDKWLTAKVKTIFINAKKNAEIDYTNYKIIEYSYRDTFIYHYDQNWILQFIEAEIEKRGSISGRDTIHYKYNLKGQLIRKYIKHLRRDGVHSTYYHYNENNQLDTIKRYSAHVEGYYNYYYLSDEEFLARFAILPEIEHLKYDNNQVICSRYLDAWIDGIYGEPYYYFKIQTYDENRFLIKEYKQEKDIILTDLGNEYTTTRFFYKKGRLIKRKITYKVLEKDKEVFKYRETKKTKYNSKGLAESITSWTFTRFKHGGIYREKDKITYEYSQN
jgi:hypothetical protein